MSQEEALLWIGSAAVTALAVVAIPWVGLRMLTPALEAGAPRVANYRGAQVWTGLGLVWLLWAIGFVLLRQMWRWFAILGPIGASGDPLAWRLPMPFVAAPAATVVFVMVLGLVDDVFGGKDAKGFSGHLRALASGRLTTGVVKLIGIGLLSLSAALNISASRVNTAFGYETPDDLVGRVSVTVLATLVIALSANVVNLLDLRPGRALKGYGLMALVALGLATQAPTLRPNPGAVGWGLQTMLLALLLLGPLLSVWKLDVKEAGMLGDAGANAFGFLAGHTIALSLPTTGLAVAAGILLVMNIASEFVSFSKLIESSRFLSWIDAAGRTNRQESLDDSP